MPRVITSTKNKAGKKIQCGRCGAKIAPGTKYFHFSFRYGGKHIRCINHPPKPSELTQSKMSGVYATIESIEDTIASVRAGKATLSDLKGELETGADEVENVQQEYQDSYDNIPESLQQGPTAEEIQEKIDALESFAQTLRDVDFEEGEEGETEEKKKERLEDALSEAESAISELSV